MKCQTCEKYPDCVTDGNIVWPCGAYVMRHPSNGEVLRSESDWDLAERLIYYRDDWDDYVTPAGKCFSEIEDAIKRTVEWLREPAELKPLLVPIDKVFSVFDEAFLETDPGCSGEVQAVLLKCRARLRKIAEDENTAGRETRPLPEVEG